MKTSYFVALITWSDKWRILKGKATNRLRALSSFNIHVNIAGILRLSVLPQACEPQTFNYHHQDYFKGLYSVIFLWIDFFSTQRTNITVSNWDCLKMLIKTYDVHSNLLLFNSVEMFDAVYQSISLASSRLPMRRWNFFDWISAQYKSINVII